MTAPAGRSDLNRNVRSASSLLIASSGFVDAARFGIARNISRKESETGSEIKMNASSVE
jgi:hypothetical protein